MLLAEFKNLFKVNKEIILILFLFIIVYSFILDKYPYIWCDESWFCNSAFTLATQGFLGTTMMPDFYNIDHFTYWQPPVYLLLLSVSFKLFGFSIIQARIVSITLGFFTVLFTYLLGTELYTKKTGLIGSILLVSNPLFFFISRDARMDIAVACFTLIALYFLFKALKKPKNIYYFYSGLFAMLSLLSHPNGLFGIFSIIVIYGVHKLDFKNFKFRLNLKEIEYFLLGPVILMIPYLIYISMDFTAFITQIRLNILSSGTSLLSNSLSAGIHYQLLLKFYIINSNWVNFILILIAVTYLVIYGLFYIIQNRDRCGVFLLIILLVYLVSFTVFISQKNSIWYLGIMLPYLSLLIAVPFKAKFNPKKIISITLTALLILCIVSNVFTISNIISTAKDYNYQLIEDTAHKYIPNGTVVAGDTAYWMLLHDSYTYYDFFNLVNYNLDPSTFKKLNVSYILYDKFWAGMNPTKFEEFLNNNCTLITEIPRNSSLGILSPNADFTPIKIYRINR